MAKFRGSSIGFGFGSHRLYIGFVLRWRPVALFVYGTGFGWYWKAK